MSHATENNLMCLGWYMRRTADSHTLGDFYRDVVGLPLLRGGRPYPVTMFWSGEATVFELKSDEEPMPARDTDPNTAPCMPIFRVHGLDTLLSRLVTGGARLAGEANLPFAREAYVLDLDDQLLVLREYQREGESPINQEACRRLDRGAAFDPKVGEMPADIQCLDGALMRVKDLPAMKAFYTDIIGFTPVVADDEHIVFDLGDNTFLELRSGGRVLPLPKDRIEVTNSFILRFQNTRLFQTQAKSRGVRFVNEHIQWKRAHLAYFADPEGRIIGIEERYDPKDYLEPVETYAEDVEAERRFHARTP